MNYMNTFQMMTDMARRSLASQKRGPQDYINDDGLLICARCRERKQEILLFPNPTPENPQNESPLKVACMCRCERDLEARAKQEEAEKQRLEKIERLRKASMIDGAFRDATFQNFKTDQNNERNLKLCRRYAEKFELMVEKNQGLLLWGGVGTGKTYAAACIANALLRRGIPVMMTSFVRLLSVIQSRTETDEEIIRRMANAKLVVFDDIGAERDTGYGLEKIYSIVDSRCRQRLPSIFTTNLTLEEMQTESDIRFARIYDRIFENCYPIQFTGVSWRMKDAYRRFSEMEALLDEKDGVWHGN